jgi:uncharacterized protein
VRPLTLTSVDGISLDAAVHVPSRNSAGTVIQVHGITADMDEGGMFVRLADRLADGGLSVIRFSFRGHGDSGGTQKGVTIAGEMLDLQAVINYVKATYPGPLSIVAASFGAVSTLLSLPYLTDSLERLVMWNPVLDLEYTFVRPELPWGLENFGLVQQELLSRQGHLLVDGEFALGRVLFEEFQHYHPNEHFLASPQPTLVVHGDEDSYVSYEIAKNAAEAHSKGELHTVKGSDHGFDSQAHEEEAIEVTSGWLLRNISGS